MRNHGHDGGWGFRVTYNASGARGAHLFGDKVAAKKFAKSLDAYIREPVIEEGTRGADGRFRWVFAKGG